MPDLKFSDLGTTSAPNNEDLLALSNWTGATFDVSLAISYSDLKTDLQSNLSFLGGSGTTNNHSKFTAPNTLGDSITRDDGTKLGLNVAPVSNNSIVADSTAGESSILTLRHSAAVKWTINKTLGVFVADQMTVGGTAAATINNQLKLVPNGSATSSLLINDTTDVTEHFRINASTGRMTSLGINYPLTDGTANQVIETDGAGNLSFVTPSSSISIGDSVGSSSANGLLYVDTSNQIAQNAGLLWVDSTGVFDIRDSGVIRFRAEAAGAVTVRGTNTNWFMSMTPGAGGDNQLMQFSNNWWLRRGATNTYRHIATSAGQWFGDNSSSSPTISAEVHIDQDDTVGAEPVLLLDQADVSEPFTKIIGSAAAATITQSLVAAADVTTATVAGYEKIEVQDDGNQITDQAYYRAFYTLT